MERNLKDILADLEHDVEELPDLRRRLGIAPPNCHRDVEMEAPEEQDDDELV